MNPETKALVATGLEQALVQRVCQLVDVLSSASPNDAAAMARYLKGLERAVSLHEELVAELEAACTASA